MQRPNLKNEFSHKVRFGLGVRMRLPDQHLSADELELLGKEGGLSGELGDQLRLAREHAESCPACRRRLEVYPTSGTKLEKLRTPQGAKKSSDCPSVDIWLQLAGGLLPSADQERYTAHAAQCDHCGPILREITKDFSDTVSEDEKSALLDLNLHDQKWMKSLPKPSIPATQTEASPVIVKPARRHPRWFGIPAWQGSAAALILVGVVVFSLFKMGVFTNREDTIATVNHLLAEAYTEQRTIELRIPGAHYAVPRVERGPGRLRPIPLVEAEGIIRRQLEKQPANYSLLQALGRIELLDWNYSLAIDTLKRALDLNPESPSLRTDLASAYFERAEDSGRQSDYNDALELLGQALQKNPDDPVALFNRAILAEKTFAYHQAVADWEHYLRICPNDEWAQEANDRLDKLRKKIQEHERKTGERMLEPSAFPSELEREHTSGSRSIDTRIEEYQQKAVEDWLEAAFNHDSSTPSVEARSALGALAGQMIDQHSDRWLSDMLQEPATPNFRAGLSSLRDAMLLSAAGEANRAELEAEKAVRSFQSAGSFAGAARAIAEKIYTFQMQLKYHECLNESRPLIRQLSVRQYRWLKAQIRMEQAICANGIEDFDGSDKSAHIALTLARSFSFPTLELRILGTDAFNLYDRGLEQKGLDETNHGLQRYWQSASPPIRGYQLYWNLFSAAEAKAQWHLAAVYGQEAVHEVALTDFKRSEAAARSRLALVAAKAGDVALAQTEASRAEDIMTKLMGDPEDPYVLDFKIARAEVDLKTGNPDAAIELLNQVKPHLGSMSHYAILLHYYATLGNSTLRKNFLGKADEALGEAVRIGNAAAKNLSSDQQRLAWERATGIAYRSAVELRMVRGDYADALKLWETYRSIAVGELDEGLVNTERIPDGVAVVWAILPDGIAIWVQSNGDIHGAWMQVDQGWLESRARKLAELCATPTTSLTEISSIGRLLYQTLLAPVSSYLRDDDLLIVEADGVLANIPVQVLENDSGKLLVDHHPVLYTLSLRHYLQARAAIAKSHIDQNSNAVIVASRQAAIPGGAAVAYNASEEARSVASHFTRAVPLLAQKGILEEIKRQLLHADVFDFVGHSTEMRGQAGLILWSEHGDMEVLKPADNHSLRLRLELAVLSACSTGKPSEDGLLDTNSLVRSFLASGTTTVVATGWSLDSEFAMQYMDLFYTEVMRGESISQSLRRSALEMRRQARYAHPYFWAAFQSFV